MAAKHVAGSSTSSGTSKKPRKPSIEDLTEEDVRNTQEVWMRIEQHHIEIGKEMLKELFSRHPDYRILFKPLVVRTVGQKRSGSALAQSPVGESYMLKTFIPGLHRVIMYMDDPKKLRSFVTDLGRRYDDLKIGLTPEHIENLKIVLYDTVKKYFEEDIPSYQEKAFRKSLDAAFEVFEGQLGR